MVELFSIPWDQLATVLSRPNRFIVIARPVDFGKTTTQLKIHLRDPGRLKELIFPGNKILIRYANSPGRKTQWDLIAAQHEKEWILVNSGFHSKIAEAVIRNRSTSPFGQVKRKQIKREVVCGNSRLDFLISTQADEKIYMEVKGCTLSRDKVALFPDAPTKRGRRHLEELIKLSREGMRTAVMFLVFRKESRFFRPNRKTDPGFAQALQLAHSNGVEIYPVLLEYRREIIWYKSIVPVIF